MERDQLLRRLKQRGQRYPNHNPLTGVFLWRGTWLARITVAGAEVSLGKFPTRAEAVTEHYFATLQFKEFE